MKIRESIFQCASMFSNLTKYVIFYNADEEIITTTQHILNLLQALVIDWGNKIRCILS